MEQPIPATPAAPAQPAPAAPVATTQSASAAAVAANDTSAFRNARRAERAGKPLPEVPVSAAAATPTVAEDGEVTEPVAAAVAQPGTTEPPKLTRREREQQETNERVRRAVDAATADLRAQLDRLQSGAPRTEPTAEPTATVPEWKRIAKLPDAPKLTDVDSQGNPLYETIEEHSAAMALFVQSKQAEQREAQSHGESLAAEDVRRIDAFDARVTELEKTTPGIGAKIVPIARALGKMGGPFGLVGRMALASEKGPELLGHFEDHKDDLKRITTLPEHLRGLPAQVQVEQHKLFIARELGKLEASFASPAATPQAQPKTITDAPDMQLLGTRAADAGDPLKAAIKSNDTRSYRRLRREQRLTAAGR